MPTSYQILPIKSTFLQRAREHATDDLGQTVERVLAKGGEPCRDALRRAEPGEELILASYCPFEIDGPYKEYGPVFILAHANQQSSPVNRLPVNGTNAYFGMQFVLRAYSASERILDACLSSPEQCEADIHRFFRNREIAFILVRFAAYGCYGCRIERTVDLKKAEAH